LHRRTDCAMIWCTISTQSFIAELCPQTGPQMSQVVIENPILNSPFREPTRHFRFSDDGITDEIVEGRLGGALLDGQPAVRGARHRQDRHQGHQPLRRRGVEGVRRVGCAGHRADCYPVPMQPVCSWRVKMRMARVSRSPVARMPVRTGPRIGGSAPVRMLPMALKSPAGLYS
jgi:hypothetical protein